MRDIRIRMKSITQTLKITSAMKLISTSKLRRARIQLNLTEPYFDRVRETMHDILLHSETIDDPCFKMHELDGKSPRRAVLVITSDKGLAGGFNHNIISLAESTFRNDETDMVIAAGSSGAKYFMRKNIPVLENFKFLKSVPIVFDAKRISDFVLAQYAAGVIDEFDIVYTRMYSSIKLVPEVLKILPISESSFGQCKPKKESSSSSLSFIPSQKTVLDSIIPAYISAEIYGALVESFASEHSARMTAMDNATKNAKDMLDRLTLSYNRLRQSAITQEVTEIVAGAAALDT